MKRFKDLFEDAKMLDQYYIPTRYMNAFAEGSAKAHFTERQAKEAIEIAERIISEMKKISYGKRVSEEIEKFCSATRGKGVRAIILFGSRAKGDYTENSDVDLCLIADDLPQDLFQRRYLAPPGYSLLSVFGFYPHEFLAMLESANLFTLDIISYGRVLYSDGFFEKIQKACYEVVKKYGLEKEERGWSWRKS